MKVQIIRANGDEESLELPRATVLRELEKLLDWDMFDTVNLRDGRVMLVDDNGIAKGKPRNERASVMYQTLCRRPNWRMWADDLSIMGDVAIVRDADFA